jgi:hypothetical protein
VLKAFIDDSGSGGDSPWYVLVGYMGNVEGWDGFDARWNGVLHQEPCISYFKSSEAERLRPDGQWAGISKERRDAKIDALIDVIGRCARRAICARMRQNDYNAIIKGNIPPMWDSPYYILFTLLIGAAINIERLDGDSESVTFVFDSDQRHEKKRDLIVPPLMCMESTYESLVNVVHCDEQKCPPLQAADLIAWQIRRFFSKQEPRRRHFDLAMRCPPKEPHTFIVDRKTAREIMDGMRRRAAELAASLGSLS